MTLDREPGRRELNKADKQRRILAAARDLFSREGYSSVTTQEVADLAEVGTGTLFRYARSKGELLCMVANEEFRAMVDTVPDSGDPVTDLVTLCDPLFSALERQPENIAAYHRETLFGEPGPHRAEAQRILGELRGIIGVILARHSGRPAGATDLDSPAQTVFDVLYMSIVRSGVERSRGGDHRADLREHVARVLYGALPGLATTDGAG
ncbi:TetR/AcrR family transcriptional regulator [Dietzia sp. PP-33]|uniref:TetR/AcrR family transcriptional regulator n=1 Tax=Dietzia sp. PP-33 TaxID=2957500 RepID=UPI0029A66818|nr:TetR/AcrR family transcriptional regulator [Dietzia sp. PP-33]MDX2355322.1 TetR/AcrR family transcriptional regulator [Dietzia sp. PP-33]